MNEPGRSRALATNALQLRTRNSGVRPVQSIQASDPQSAHRWSLAQIERIHVCHLIPVLYERLWAIIDRTVGCEEGLSMQECSFRATRVVSERAFIVGSLLCENKSRTRLSVYVPCSAFRVPLAFDVFGTHVIYRDGVCTRVQECGAKSVSRSIRIQDVHVLIGKCAWPWKIAVRIENNHAVEKNKLSSLVSKCLWTFDKVYEFTNACSKKCLLFLINTIAWDLPQQSRSSARN